MSLPIYYIYGDNGRKWTFYDYEKDMHKYVLAGTIILFIYWNSNDNLEY